MEANQVQALPIEIEAEAATPAAVAAETTAGEIKKTTSDSGRPAWCKPFPAGFQVPKGKRVMFMRFRPEWTDSPHLGEAQCVCWGITVHEENIADRRADEGGLRVVHERAKMTIRAIARGGQPTLLQGDPTKAVREADLDVFWEEIGLQCRAMIVNTFIQTHSLSLEQRRDFFENCIEIRDAI